MSGFWPRFCRSAGKVLTIAAYLTLNSGLNLVNKWALGWFPFPLLLTGCHMATSFFLLMPVMLADSSKNWKDLRNQKLALCMTGILLGCNIGLNNLSLLGMTLSLNQVIRASIPVFTCITSMMVEMKLPTIRIAVSLMALSFGVMICTWESGAAGSTAAVTICVMGTICNAAMMSFSGRVMTKNISPLQLTFATAPISLAVVTPVILVHEAPALKTLYLSTVPNPSMLGTSLLLVLSSIAALLYNIIHALLIRQTSAVTTTVIGQIKIVGLVLCAAFILGESAIFTKQMTLGTGIALLGFMMYSFLKLSAAKQEPTKPIDQGTPVDEETAASAKLLGVAGGSKEVADWTLDHAWHRLLFFGSRWR